MNLTETRKGELYILSEVTLWAFFPIVSILTYSSLTPLYSYGLGISIASILFAILVTIKKDWVYFKRKEAIKYSLGSALIIGIGYYLLVFFGFQLTTAGNASIVMLMEILFSYMIFNMFMKEKHKKSHIFGVTLMMIGAVIILFPGEIKLNLGDLLILVATMIVPFANHLQQKARKLVSTEFHLFIRTASTSIVILIIALIFDTPPTKEVLQNSLIFLLINGIFLLGISKIFWIEAIHRMPVSKAISFSTISPAITLTFAYFILGEMPTIWQILGFIPIALGALFILDILSIKKDIESYLFIEIQMAQMEFFGIKVIETFESLDAANKYLKENKDKVKNDHPWSGDNQTHIVKKKGNELYWLDGRKFEDGWKNYFKFNSKRNSWNIMDENNKKKF